MTTFDIEGDNEVQSASKVHRETQREYTSIRRSISRLCHKTIWEFPHRRLSSVLNKWLEDRRGRKLSYDDLQHYQKIVVALSETIRIMSEIDAAIPQFPLE